MAVNDIMDIPVDQRTKNLGDEAFDRIKHDIIWCRLRPGEEISENRLTQIYGLGKAPIRRALSRLTQEGYVISVPRHGHIIAPVTLQTIRELFELRLLLEPAAVQKACGRIDTARLRALNERCAKGYLPGDEVSEKAFMEANQGFHLEIAHACGNQKLAAILSQIMDEMARLLHLGFILRERPEVMMHEHADLLEAVESGDPAKAYNIAVAHINSSRTLVLDGIMTHTNLSDTSIQPR
ncbi:GntR family transcriptional regulator [Pusillimonas caeni]|uniref:GntR family transcriptional regulator n=1 Tax=Pusillimonas caeni TaxID=1348472 RepID=UPI0014320765|nr:GntR family transcriptional regulator [Pusillimonas caeni]